MKTTTKDQFFNNLAKGVSSKTHNAKSKITIFNSGEVETRVYLHDNCIVTINDFGEGYSIVINSCGWPTQMTQSYLNGVFKALDIKMRCHRRKNKRTNKYILVIIEYCEDGNAKNAKLIS